MERARIRTDIPALRVNISETSSLIQQCRAVINSSPMDTPSHSQSGSSLNVILDGPKSKKTLPKRLNTSHGQSPSSSQVGYAAFSGVLEHRSFFQALKSPRNQLSQASKNGQNFSICPANTKELPSRNVSDSITSSFVCLPFPPKRPDLPENKQPSVSDSSTILTPSHLRDTVLNLSFKGETITFNLKSLEQNPRPIIELLKATDSERGSWIKVAAYYRYLGNTRAAISVAQAMIDVMTRQGLSEDDLKPVFLLLAGCEIDLAKRAKSTELGTAPEHYKASQTWLQKVYGPMDRISTARKPEDSNIGAKNSSIPRQPRALNNLPVFHNFDQAAVSPPTEITPRERVLEREIRSLLAIRDEQLKLLSELRSGKRKLEDGIEFERSGRRRLLRDVDDLERELFTARKMENYASDQVRREVDARRKAEREAQVEKEMRLELQKMLEQTSGMPLSETANTLKMAGLLTPTNSKVP